MEFTAMSLAIFLISSLGIGQIRLQLSLILKSAASTNISEIQATQEFLKTQENKHMKIIKIKLPDYKNTAVHSDTCSVFDSNSIHLDCLSNSVFLNRSLLF